MKIAKEKEGKKAFIICCFFFFFFFLIELGMERVAEVAIATIDRNHCSVSRGSEFFYYYYFFFLFQDFLGSRRFGSRLEAP